jgi:hypothetical protein
LKERRPIPGQVKDRLMAANRHTCCVCHEPRHPVEKHHINGDPADNAWDNLAVVCRNCHGLVTAKGNLGSQYTPGEVLQYKKLWEKRCAEADAEDIDSPIAEVYETKLIDGDEHETYPFEMEAGDELVFSIDANDCLDIVICDEEDIDEWAEEDEEDEEEEDDDDEGDEDERPLPEGYWHKTNVITGEEYRFVAEEDGRYVLLLINWDEEATEVTVDAAAWKG